MSRNLSKIPFQNGLKRAIDGRGCDRDNVNRPTQYVSRQPIKFHQSYNKCLTMIALYLIALYCLLLMGCTPLNSIPANSGSLDSSSHSSDAPHSQTSYMLSNTVVVAEPNNVNIAVVDGLTILEIESPNGFGSAQFTLAEFDAGFLDTANEQEKSQRLEQLTLTFHLSSLEQLRIVTSDIILTASISGSESTALFQEVATRQKGREATSDANNEKTEFGDFQLITSESPFWLDVQVTPSTTQSADGESEGIGQEKANAMAEQTIRVTVPMAFIQEAVSADDGGKISIEWIDFYR